MNTFFNLDFSDTNSYVFMSNKKLCSEVMVHDLVGPDKKMVIYTQDDIEQKVLRSDSIILPSIFTLGLTGFVVNVKLNDRDPGSIPVIFKPLFKAPF